VTQFKILKPRDYFMTNNTGLQIAPEARCEHDQAAIFLVLFGKFRSQPGQPELALHALLPRCVMAEAIGALQAQILREEGETALQQFQDDVDTYTDDSCAALEQLHIDQRDCCEAGFRTNGREHTCGRNEAQK